jgi:hypothetical protein
MGPQVEVVGFDDAEVAFDVGEVFAAGHDGGGVGGVGVDAGAQHVMPSMPANLTMPS